MVTDAHGNGCTDVQSMVVTKGLFFFSIVRPEFLYFLFLEPRFSKPGVGGGNKNKNKNPKFSMRDINSPRIQLISLLHKVLIDMSQINLMYC